MDAPAERAQRREEGGKPQASERRGSSRGRGDGGAPGGGGRPPQEPRRKRGEQRYAGFGDGLERAFCTQGTHLLPRDFPVESHPGTATIRAEVVARRQDALLLCTYSHCGDHVWPDGELVTEEERTP